jgi:hypothetical protein
MTMGWGCLDVGGQVFARMVSLHVKAALPHFAGRHVNDLAAVGDVHRFSILTAELSKFFRAEFLVGHSFFPLMLD